MPFRDSEPHLSMKRQRKFLLFAEPGGKYRGNRNTRESVREGPLAGSGEGVSVRCGQGAIGVSRALGALSGPHGGSVCLGSSSKSSFWKEHWSPMALAPLSPGVDSRAQGGC